MKIGNPFVFFLILFVLLGSPVGCVKAGKVEYPSAVCALEQAEGRSTGWACDCGPVGLVFVYRPVMSEGKVIKWETRRTCGGHDLPGVMRSDKFPAWVGPPPSFPAEEAPRAK